MENKEKAEVDMDMGSEVEKGASQVEGNPLVDRFVKKDFGPHGEFIGNVMSYDSSVGYYLVFYEDGDKEDFELDELTGILIPEVEVTAEITEKFEKLKRKTFGQKKKRDTCRRLASPGTSSGPAKRSRREKSNENEVAIPEPCKRVGREKSKVNEGGSTGPTKRARREKSNINEVRSLELPKRARREKSKVNVVASSEPTEEKPNVNSEVVGDGMKPERKVNLDVDGDYMKPEPNVNSEVVGDDMKPEPNVNSKVVGDGMKLESIEGTDNVDGKIRVGQNFGGAMVEHETNVPDSADVDSKSNTEPKDGEDNVDGKIRVAENSGGAEVEKDLKLLDSVAVDSKSNGEPKEGADNVGGAETEKDIKVSESVVADSICKIEAKEGADNVEGKIRVGKICGGAGVEKGSKVPHNSVSVDSKNKTNRRGTKRKTNIEVAASMTVSSQEESRKSQRHRRSRGSQYGVNAMKLDDNEVKEFAAPENLEMLTQGRRRGRPRKDRVTENSQKCSAQKELGATTQRRSKSTMKKNANGLEWSDSGDGNNGLSLEDVSFTVGNEEVSLDVDASDCNDSDEIVLSRATEYQLPPMQPLPQSSGDITLPDYAVPDLLSVYTFLRVSSDLLFLSPFTLEDFLGAVHFRTMNSLLDSVHVSLLRALRRHLEMLLTEGNNRASTCLRQLDWDFLDAVTWPFYLAVYLLTQRGSEKLGLKIVNLNILDGEYYRIMASTKLTILQVLCDDVMETEEFRTKINMSIDFEHDIDADEKMNMFSTPNAFNGSNPCYSKSKLISSSNGDIQKSSHESINSISDNSILQNKQGNSSNGEDEFTTVPMNDGEDFNSDECRLCGMDGGLLCCDSCPSAYHSRCVGMLKAHIPQGPWYCLECVVKKNDPVGLKALETLNGAEIFGIDPYGRVFFGTCGYLLVADFSSNPIIVYRYYSKSDAKMVVDSLSISGPFYSEIISAILQYWGVRESKNDLTCLQNSDTIYGISPTELSYMSFAEHLVMQDEASRSGHPSGSTERKTYKTSCAHVHECLVNPNNAKLTKETEIAIEGDGQLFAAGISNGKENGITSTKGSPAFDPNTLMDINVHRTDLGTSRLSGQVQAKTVSISIQEQAVLNVIEVKGSHSDVCNSNLSQNIEQRSDADKITIDKVDSKTSFWGSRSSFQPDAYRNHYALGDIAASAAAMLASMSVENNTLANTRGVSKRTIQEQVKVISKVSSQFYWPSSNKKAMEPPRERCGWCISCKSTATCRRACLLNVAASNAMGGAANVLGGIRSIKNGEGHLPAVAAYILYIEDCLHGLVVGPWENLSYRKHWRKCVEQASTVKEISTSFLELERNIRLIALAPGWTKHVEDPTSLVSTIHSATNVATPAPRRGRRSHKTSISAVTVPLPNDLQKTTLRWWKGGRLHNQVFQQSTLPCAIAKRTGRQGGLKKIPGVLYAEGSDIPIKSRQYIWRTAVEMATSLSQLAVQVRYLDTHVKWKDLEFPERHSQDVRAAVKAAASFPNATICDKKHEGGDVQYLLDFGNEIDIPISVVNHGTQVKETQEGNNRYWLGEFYVPLYLVKAFEERLLQVCQINGYKQVLKNQNRLVQRSGKKHVFSVLLSEAEMKEKSSCVHCGGDVSIRKAVKCTSCAGSFHSECTVKSVTLDKSECHFTCYKCHNIKLIERRDNRNHKIVNVESKKNVGNKLAEIEGSCLRPFGASTNLQDYLGIALNPPRRRRSNTGPVWKKNGGHELGREFRKNYLLLPCDTENDVGASDGPKCYLCSQAYDPKLLFIGCTSCRAWFHGEAFNLKQENILDLIGFKCHKCRKKGRPECPYETMDSKVRREKLPVRRQPKVNSGKNHGLKVTDGKPSEMMHSNSGKALNDGLWTVSDDEEKHFATKSEPDTDNALYANLLKGNQQVYTTVKSEPDLNNAFHSYMLKDDQKMYSGVKSEPDLYHSSEVHQCSESKIFQHLEPCTVGTETSSPQVEWNFPIMAWPQKDQQIEARSENLNSVEAYNESEPLFTFTELLAGDNDQVEDLVNISEGVVDNWTGGLPTGKEINMDSQTNGVDSRECLSAYVMSSKTSDSQQDDKHDILTTFQVDEAENLVVLDETQVSSMDNTVRSGEMLSECKVCGIADLLPHYQCNACGEAIHHHCFQVQQIGFWNTSGSICNSCHSGLLKGL